ncbi:MAG: hypothetical protein ACRD1T_20875, partial [Acidimicrobiia bacterium]
MRILQVSIFDLYGGGERVAWHLFQAFRERGHDSWLAVGQKTGTDPHVVVIPNDEVRQRQRWYRFWRYAAYRLPSVRGAWRLSNLAASLAEPGRMTDTLFGFED